MIAFLFEPALLVATDLGDDLVIEVLDDVEVVEYRLYPLAGVLECLLEVRVHVTGDGLNRCHPFESDMGDEVVYYLLLLAVAYPEDVTILHIYDVCSIAAPVVELELIDAKYARCLFGLLQMLAV